MALRLIASDVSQGTVEFVIPKTGKLYEFPSRIARPSQETSDKFHRFPHSLALSHTMSFGTMLASIGAEKILRIILQKDVAIHPFLRYDLTTGIFTTRLPEAEKAKTQTQ